MIDADNDIKGEGSVVFTCEYCGEKFLGHPSRTKATHICCSKKCMGALIKSRQEPNCTCPICGKKFHIKPSQKAKYKTHCCSYERLTIQRRNYMLGENNHQFGLKGQDNPTWKTDVKITHYGYRKIRVLDHPFRDCNDFVLEHRLVAEQYLLTEENSIEIDGKRYLKPEYDVHHIDENRLNNAPSNLQILTKQQHRALHNKKHPNSRDSKGRFIGKDS